MMQMIPMKEEHIDDVVQVEESCFHIPWTKKDFERELFENKMAVYRVVLEDNKVIGYAGMWHVVNEGHITNVAVLEQYRRRGVGDILIQEMIRVAEQKEMIGITLEVRISNLAAQRLYTKYGFKPEGFRKRYYADTGEDAIIMWKYFPIYEAYEKTL